MNVKDIMTTRVVTVAPETLVRDAALILAEKRISGMPVVSGAQLVGIVSEADFLRRHEIDTDERWDRLPWWKRLLEDERRPAGYIRSHAARVADVMTRAVVTVAETAPIASAAAILERRRVRRLPVMRGDELAGILTRADIVRALARRARRTTTLPLGDPQIQWMLLTELSGQRWWEPGSAVRVKDGVVHYWGLCESELQRQAARVAAENIPGVRGVVDHRLLARQLPFMG